MTELEIDEEEDVVLCLLEAIVSNRSEAIEWQELKITINGFRVGNEYLIQVVTANKAINYASPAPDAVEQCQLSRR